MCNSLLWSHTRVYVLFSILSNVGREIKEMKEGVFSHRSIFVDRRLICHRASLSCVSTQSYLGSFQYDTVFSCGPLRVRGFGSSLTAAFARIKLFYLPDVSPCELHLSLTTCNFGDHLPRAPGDLGLAVGKYEMKTAASGCYTTSLHKAGLQKISALWSEDDLHPVTDAESGSFTVSLLFSFSGWVFFFFLRGTRPVTRGMWAKKKKKSKV